MPLIKDGKIAIGEDVNESGRPYWIWIVKCHYNETQLGQKLHIDKELCDADAASIYWDFLWKEFYDWVLTNGGRND